VPEAVPPDLLHDPDPLQCRPDVALEDHIGLDGLRPLLLNRGEEVVIISPVQRCLSPPRQLFNNDWVERNRLALSGTIILAQEQRRCRRCRES
jgi:hypothetical protein